MLLAPAGQSVSVQLYNLKSQYVATLEEVRSVQERALRDIQERAAKEQELRQDLQGTRDKVDRLKSMLEGAAKELRTEVQDLRGEHQELEGELRALVDMAQKGYLEESENRAAAAAELKRQATSCAEKQASDRAKREALVERVRQEVTSAMQAQTEQEANALAQSTEFIREVNVALQSEGSERARRDQTIEQAVQVTKSMVVEVNSRLREASDALNVEVASRQKDNERRKQETEEMWQNIWLQQRKVEAQHSGQIVTGGSSARPVGVYTAQSATPRGDARQSASGYGAAMVSSISASQALGQVSSIGGSRTQIQNSTQIQGISRGSIVSQSPERKKTELQQGVTVLPRQVPVQWIGPNVSGSVMSSMVVPGLISPRQVQSPVTSQVQLLRS